MKEAEPKKYSFEAERRVEFSETDMAGIMHFSNFYRFMESTEHAFFRSIDQSVHGIRDGEHIGWPRVKTSCEFFRPLRFEDIVLVKLSIAEIRSSAVRYAFDFFLKGDTDTLVAKGEVTAACVKLDTATGAIKAIPIPDDLRAQLEAAK